MVRITKIKNKLTNRSQNEMVDKKSSLSLCISTVSSWFCYTHCSMTLKQLAGDPKVRGNQLNTHSHHKSVARKLYVVLDGINKYTCENRLMDLEIGVKLDFAKIFTMYKTLLLRKYFNY